MGIYAQEKSRCFKGNNYLSAMWIMQQNFQVQLLEAEAKELNIKISTTLKKSMLITMESLKQTLI